MRYSRRNQRIYWYAQYIGASEMQDEHGNFTGEYRANYAEPVKSYANISPARGQSQIEQFGNLENYDKVLAMRYCPFDENAVLFIDKEPETDADGAPLYDYIVRRIARSMNGALVAAEKADVS